MVNRVQGFSLSHGWFTLSQLAWLVFSPGSRVSTRTLAQPSHCFMGSDCYLYYRYLRAAGQDRHKNNTAEPILTYLKQTVHDVALIPQTGLTARV